MFTDWPQLRWTDALDILLVALAIWALFGWLRQTRSRLALQGVLLLSGVYLLSRQLNLQLSLWILQAFFAVLVIVLVVVFQEDLKRFFERLAIWGLQHRTVELATDGADAILRAVTRLAQARRGALIVIAGREPLERHLEGGIEVDGKPSEILLLSLFNPSSPSHDGAVVLDNGRLARFGVHLPLSTEVVTGAGGTRHAAALGLAELTDALAIVVSEERGTISVARSGELRRMANVDQLAAELRRHLDRVVEPAEAPRNYFLVAALRHWPEAVAALLLATLLWAALVPGSTELETTYRAAVQIENLPADFELKSIEPAEVEVVLAGPQRYHDPKNVHIRLDADLVAAGRRNFRLTADNIDHPARLKPVLIKPDRIKLDVVRRPTPLVNGRPRG
jgi:diadenylate cyclase